MCVTGELHRSWNSSFVGHYSSAEILYAVSDREYLRVSSELNFDVVALLLPRYYPAVFVFLDLSCIGLCRLRFQGETRRVGIGLCQWSLCAWHQSELMAEVLVYSRGGRQGPQIEELSNVVEDVVAMLMLEKALCLLLRNYVTITGVKAGKGVSHDISVTLIDFNHQSFVNYLFNYPIIW
jgi:hypothetical protein